jgi:hypothetical protein
MDRSEHLTESEHNAIEAAAARAKLPEAQRAVLDAIIAGGSLRLAWMPAGELVGAGHDPDVIEGMTRAGLVVEWMLAGVVQVTLHQHAAWLMQVHILERTSIIGEELEEDPYWAELTKEPQSLQLPRRRHEIRYPWMDEFADPESVKGPQVLEDDEGEPVLVMGRPVPIDRRLGKKTAKAKQRRAG